jgi:hypothetical protein
MKDIYIYSDESRHRNEKFLLLGGIWVEKEKLPIVDEAITHLRNKYGYTNNAGDFVTFLGELKWTKVSEKYLPLYQEVVDLFFTWIEDGTIRSCIMLVDTQDPLVIERSNLKKEGYFKLLYQLYLHNSKVPGIHHIFPDRITNPDQKVNLETLHKCLDVELTKKFSSVVNPALMPSDGFVKNITPMESKDSSCIQIIDVMMGAIGYFQNRHFEKDGASSSKKELMKYVMDKLIYSGTIKIEGKKYLVARSTKFNIWLFRPKNNHKNKKYPPNGE